MARATVLLLAVFMANIVRCDTNKGFVFPPNATLGEGDTTIANITVHFNDSMIVEYNLPDTEGQVYLLQSCYASVKSMESIGETFYQGSAFNNTGALHFNVGNGNDGNYTNINICSFSLMNYTMVNCRWGPWGILTWNQTQVGIPLLSSQFFKMSAPKNGTKPTLFINEETSSSLSRSTATPGTVTCPPSGIPALPIYTPIPTIDQIPAMASNITFPH
ncbi:uncharacterized protein PAC_01227 [Phialocephala subalpina]|uniref:Uncharacterized protein n=1 Tax=Phialocephala subalpina TaxID=576137 RepID=A0A1L7WEZ0_9HELO|nr:uncharacterized protein PAC_01227 [Phialocephala subalpina]